MRFFIRKEIKALAADMINNYKDWGIYKDLLYKKGTPFYIKAGCECGHYSCFSLPGLTLRKREIIFMAKAFNQCVVAIVTDNSK